MPVSSYNEFFGLGTHSEPSVLDGWWKLQDESGSSIEDATSNSNSGTLNGGYDIEDIATTGPTNWLSQGLDLDGMGDYLSFGTIAGYSKTTAFSAGLWVRPDGAINYFQTFMARQRQPSTFDGWTLRVGGSGSREKLAFYIHDGSDNMYRIANSNIFSSSQWYFIGASYDGSNSVGGITLYLNGSSVSSTAGSDTTLSGTINYSSSSGLAIGARDEDQGGIFDGIVGSAFIASKEMTAAEWDEVYDGPEPLNTVAPSISGNAPVGSTLTCDGGSWDGQSNGTVTVSYQWKRNGSNISGATSSTYTTVSDDAGASVTCQCTGSNDGGSDSGQATSSNAIVPTAAAGAGGYSVMHQYYQQLLVGGA
tara:strand:- start:14072 stop:15163 length:1092 start_codon:yes stop_codon:yes gene_type:complete